MNDITVKLNTTAKDFKTLTFFNMFQKKRGFLIFIILGAVCSLGAILGRLTDFVEMSDWYFLVCVAFFGLLLLQYILFEYSVKRFLSSDRLVIDNERTVTIKDTGLEESGGREHSAGYYRWEVFYSVYDTKKYFYLYINTIQAIVLPKRYFGSEETHRIQNLLKEKMGRKYYKR